MKKIVILFLIWRVGLFAISAIGPKVLPVHGNTFPYLYILEEESRLPRWLNSFGGFDGVYYLRIAKDGYEHKFTQAFFPLYPILIRTVSYLVGKNLLISALLISNTLFLFSLLIFYKLVKSNYSEKIATWACIFLACFPTSFYFGSVYTEPLFFLLILLSFYFYEKEKFIISSIFGLFSSSTRLIGVFLVPAMFNIKEIKKSLFTLIIPIGLLFYMAYLYVQFNNPLYFLTSQSIFGQARSTSEVVLLPQVFYRYLKIFLTVSGMPLINAVFEFASTLTVFILLILSFRRIKKEWIIFSALSVILPTLTGTLASMPRYILIAFPIYIYLAMIKNTWIKISILLIFILILIPAVILFTRGYWVA